MLRLHNEMAISSINQNDWCMSCFLAFRQMFIIKMLRLERQAPIAILSWVVKTASHGGIVIEVAEVA